MSAPKSEYQSQGTENNEIIVFQKVANSEAIDDYSSDNSSVYNKSNHSFEHKQAYQQLQKKFALAKKIAIGAIFVLMLVIILLASKAINNYNEPEPEPGPAQSLAQKQPSAVQKDAQTTPNNPSASGQKVEPKKQSPVSSEPKRQPSQPPKTTPTNQPQPPTTTPQPQSKEPSSTPNPQPAIKSKLQKIVRPITVSIADSKKPATIEPDHSDLTFDYPTLGVPIPGKKFNNTPVAKEDLGRFDDQINELFKPYNDTDCQFERYGEGNDGGYVICKNYFNGAQGMINIGINGFDDLGCDITSNHPMPNYQYDCTNPRQTVCKTNNGMNQFNYICIGTVTEKNSRYTFYTYQDILKAHDLVGKHVIFKIDTEGGEYPGLKYLPVKHLEYIDVLIIELHFSYIHREEWGNLDIMRTLASHFVNVNYHFTNWGCIDREESKWRHLPARAVELTLINKNLIKLNSNSRSYALHPLNTKGKANAPDCQMPV